jgi:uncharacterized protein YrrD
LITLRKSQEVIGLPVTTRESGKQLGAVVDLLFNNEQQFIGCMLEHCGWWRKRRFLPTEKMTQIGRDTVMVEDLTSALPFTKQEEAYTCFLSGENSLRGRSILLANGTFLGLIENVYFLADMGTLIWYELSNGLFNDLRVGRKLFKAKEPVNWGGEVLIAPSTGYELKDAN